VTTVTPVVGLTTRPTTGTKTIPPHGTQYRYKGRPGVWPGCRCTKCTRAHTLACTQRALAHLRGEPPLHPAGPVIAHIRHLNETGMSTDLVARRAGVSPNTLSYLLRGLTKTCRRTNALKILAVQPGDFDDVAEVPSLGSRRRLQALYALGHSPRTLAAATKLCPSSVTHIANGKVAKVDAATANAISQAYVSLSAVEGSSDAARRRATQMGWRDPLWWEDMGHLDDPTFDPATAERPLNFHERAELRATEILHLASYGATPEEIADRLGIGRDYVAARLRELREVAA
jgi:DNA-binding CsgD family transcriptional regulator